MPKLPSLKQAKALLEAISSAEQAVKLTGAERAAYLGALEKVHGPKEARAAAMGFGDDSIKFFDQFDLPKEIEIPDAHLAPGEMETPRYAGENHRLDQVQDITYAVKNNKVVGHVGLNDTNQVNAAYIDPELQGKGIGTALYKHLAGTRGEVRSDALNAMEPGAKALWKKLKNELPNSVALDKEGYTLSKKNYNPDKINAVDRVSADGTPRSTNAAFDPRFKDSNKLMAGMAGAGVLGASALGNNEAEAAPTSKMYKVGKQVIEARNMGEALGARRALAAEGKVSHTATVVEHEGTSKLGKVKVVPGIAAMGAMPPVDASPMDALRGLGNAWQQNVVDPIAGALKGKLTPDMQVQGTSYPTSSPVSDGIINMAADPVNYVPGGAGAVIGGAQAVAGYADGGIVKPQAKTEQYSDTTPIYDMSGPEPVLGEVPHDQLGEALASGRFSLPQGATLDVESPDGQLGTIPSEHARDALAAGFKYIAPKQAKFGTDAQGALAMVEGAADMASFGLAGAITNAGNKAFPDVFASPEDRLARAEVNPGSRMAGQAIAMFAPGGAGGAMLKAGEMVAAKLAAKTVAGRIGSAAARGAVENVIFQSGDEVAHAFMNDPHQTAETVLTNVGLSAAIGGTLGAGTGGVQELWALGPGKKLTQVLNGLQSKAKGLTAEEARMAGLDLPPEILASMEPGFAREQGVALQQSDTLAGRHFQKNLDNTYGQLEAQVNTTLGKTTQDIEKLADVSDHAAGSEIRKTLQQEVTETYEPIRKAYKDVEAKLTGARIQPEGAAELGNELTNIIASNGLEKAVDEGALRLVQKTLEKLGKQETAQDLRLLAQNLADAHPFGSDTYQVAKQVVAAIKKAQDSTMVTAAEGLGGLNFANEFKALQAKYRQFKSVINDTASYLGMGRVQGKESFAKALAEKLDGADVARRSSKDSVELRQLLDQNFPQTAARARQHEVDTLLAKSRTKAGDAIDINKLAKNLEKLDPESRAAMLNSEQLSKLSALHDVAAKLPKNDNYSGTAKALMRQWGAIPATAGGMVGLLAGDSKESTLLGMFSGAMMHQAGPAMRLAALRFLASDAPVSAQGFKAMLGMAKAAQKGEQKLEQAAEAVFTGAKNGTAEVSKEAVQKLKGQVDAVSAQPELLMAIGEDVGHYMPETAEAVSMAASRNIMYLASLRPQTAPLSPLDGIRKVSKQEESEYERALEIAENPLVVLDHVRNGRLDPKDLQHLQTMNPKAYARMQQKVSEQLAKHLADSGSVPYKTQMGLSVFLQQPMSSSMQPQAIMAAQPKPQQARMPNATGAKALQKMPTMYQTPQQSRQQHKLK